MARSLLHGDMMKLIGFSLLVASGLWACDDGDTLTPDVAADTSVDSTSDAPSDLGDDGADTSEDGSADVGADSVALDVTVDTAVADSGTDVTVDAAVADSGTDVATDSGTDVAVDTAIADSGSDAAVDSGVADSGTDGGQDIANDSDGDGDGTSGAAKTYPPNVSLATITYEPYTPPQGGLPAYLEPFTEPLFGHTVTRIGDATAFGVSDHKIRHNYAKDQTWNSDGTLIKLSGYPAAILDGNTYELLSWAGIPSYGRWAHTDPHKVYGSSSSTPTFRVYDVMTDETTVLHTFAGFDEIDFGYGEGNQSNDDRYVGLIGSNSSGQTLIVYDIEQDVVVGTKALGNTSDLDWFSVSQLGGFAVASWTPDGNGSKQGIKTYSLDMTNELHISDISAHGDLGVDAAGNEVIVAYGADATWDTDHSLFMARLDGGGITNLYPYVNGKGIWGGHISTRNILRPGWAYVSEQCCTSNLPASREIFALKLDGSGTVQRFAKHHNDVTPGNGHSTMAVPNHDGTKVLFASNWDDDGLMSVDNPPSWIVEVPQL